MSRSQIYFTSTRKSLDPLEFHYLSALDEATGIRSRVSSLSYTEYMSFEAATFDKDVASCQI